MLKRIVVALLCAGSTVGAQQSTGAVQDSMTVRARQIWFSSLSRDSAAKAMQQLQYAWLRIGSPTVSAVFYVNGEAVGPITRVGYWLVPAGRPVAIAIRSEKCTAPWDTTIMVTAGQEITIGRRLPKNCTP